MMYLKLCLVIISLELGFPLFLPIKAPVFHQVYAEIPHYFYHAKNKSLN